MFRQMSWHCLHGVFYGRSHEVVITSNDSLCSEPSLNIIALLQNTKFASQHGSYSVCNFFRTTHATLLRHLGSRSCRLQKKKIIRNEFGICRNSLNKSNHYCQTCESLHCMMNINSRFSFLFKKYKPSPSRVPSCITCISSESSFIIIKNKY